MKFWKKLIEIPATNETEIVEAVQLWEVRWDSRHSEYASGTQPEIEAFPSEVEAQRYATALRNAFKLIRHTSGNSVSVTKAKASNATIAAKLKLA